MKKGSAKQTRVHVLQALLLLTSIVLDSKATVLLSSSTLGLSRSTLVSNLCKSSLALEFHEARICLRNTRMLLVLLENA